MSFEDIGKGTVARRRQIAAILMGTLVAVFLGGMLLLMRKASHLNLPVRLTDGRVVIVNDVTFGRTPYYEPGAPRWDWFTGKRPLPNLRSDTLSVWLSEQTGSMQSPRAFTDFGLVVAIDSHGHQFVYPVVTVCDLPTVPLPFLRTGTLTRLDFSSFPRREKIIRLQVLDTRGKLLGECVVANPGFIQPRELTPERLPTTHQVGDLSVTLFSAYWQSRGEGMDFKVQYNGVHVTDPEHLLIDWGCSQNGKSSSDWEDINRTLTDATGNSANLDSNAADNGLCPREPAYRLRLRLARKVSALFDARETWSVSGVSVPESGKMRMLQEQQTLSGVALTLHSISTAPIDTYTQLNGAPYVRPGSVKVIATGTPGPSWNNTWAGGVSKGASPNAMEIRSCSPQVAVGVGGLREDQRLTIWATDAKGTRYNENPGGPTGVDTDLPWPHADELQVHSVKIPLAVRKVDLHFCVQTTHDVEFTISPTIGWK